MANINPIKGKTYRHSGRGVTMDIASSTGTGMKQIKPYHETLRYGYTVGRIMVQEAQLLAPHHVERLVEADFDEALNILDETAMGDYLAEARMATDIDKGLADYLGDVYAFLEDALPGDSFLIDFFLCRYDFHNLKALLKATGDGKGEEGLLPKLGRISVETLRRGLADPSSLPSPYREAATQALERKLTAQDLDTALDGYFLTYRSMLAEQEKSSFVKQYVRLSIDFSNLKTIIRGYNLGKDPDFMEKALLEGGEMMKGWLLQLYGGPPEDLLQELGKNKYASEMLSFLDSADEVVRLTDFDRKADDYLMEMLRNARRISVGVEPVFAFVRARENEAMVVRIILMAKLHNIPPVAIEKMLRKLYVD